MINLQEIKFHLNLFSQQIQDTEGTAKLRNLLKKHLLTEIMKSGEDQEFYRICLAETNNALNIGNKETGYRCMLVGCKFLAKRHQNLCSAFEEVSSKSEKCMLQFQKIM